jgi:hypothetical protein
MAIRGKVKEFFSDRGTNFIGGAKELELTRHLEIKHMVSHSLMK